MFAWPTYAITWGCGRRLAGVVRAVAESAGRASGRVSGPGSTEVYQTFAIRRSSMACWTFCGAMEAMCCIASAEPHQSLARVVPRRSLVARTPMNGADVDPLRGYVTALEDMRCREAEFRWTSRHSARIVTEFGNGQVVSWQDGVSSGLAREVDGKAIADRARCAGLMTIYPEMNGPIDDRPRLRRRQWRCGSRTGCAE